MSARLTYRNTSLRGTQLAAAMFYNELAKAARGHECKDAMARALVAANLGGSPANAETTANIVNALPKGKVFIQSHALNIQGGGQGNGLVASGGGRIIGADGNPAGGSRGSAGCDPCASNGCNPPLDGLPNGIGDSLIAEPRIRLYTVNGSCAAILNTAFAQIYEQNASSFVAALTRAKSLAQASRVIATGVASSSSVSLNLNAPAGVAALKTLGLVVRVALPELGANAPYVVRVTGVMDVGAFDTGSILAQNTSTRSPGLVYISAFQNVNQGTYYYQPLELPAAPATTLTVTVTGLAANSVVTVESIPTDDPNFRAFYAPAGG